VRVDVEVVPPDAVSVRPEVAVRPVAVAVPPDAVAVPLDAVAVLHGSPQPDPRGAGRAGDRRSS
jgi:hypothetical protein